LKRLFSFVQSNNINLNLDYQKCIIGIKENGFSSTALEVFQYQYKNVKIYRRFSDLLGRNPKNVSDLKQIPFLPISFFKSNSIKNSTFTKYQEVFSSSGTTGANLSQHFIPNVEEYENNFKMNFEYFYGPLKNYVVIGLLPSYLERKGSSLIYMVNQMIKISNHQESGFYLNEHDQLINALRKLVLLEKKILLIGVSFALLDLVENHKKELHELDLSNLIVMETGGMKGRRKEIVRPELHKLLQNGFGIDSIASEYGMTEMLSQSYAKKDGLFQCPPTLQFLLRDTEDPLSVVVDGKVGGINFIDLANVSSLSFVATQDLGRKINDNTFEILGRFDNSDIRGCNLMVI